jgi:hypothetical protein
MERPVICFLSFLCLASVNLPAQDILDEYGHIKQSVADSYFAKIEKYLLPSDIPDNVLMSSSNERELLNLMSPAKGMADYALNIAAKNYYVVQRTANGEILEIAVPRTTETPEGKRLWKLQANFLLRISDGHVSDYYWIHEKSFGRLQQIRDYYWYVSVDASLGMNYVLVRLLVFNKKALQTPVTDQIVFSSGSIADNVMFNFTFNQDSLFLSGFTGELDSKKVQTAQTTIPLP